MYLNAKSICLICNANVTLPKKGNLERHFKPVHKSYDTNFPAKSPLRARKIQELKSQLAAQQSVFTRPNTKSKAATIASYRVSRVPAKGNKSFKDGEIVKEAFMEGSDVLFAVLKIERRLCLLFRTCSYQ